MNRQDIWKLVTLEPYDLLKLGWDSNNQIEWEVTETEYSRVKIAFKRSIRDVLRKQVSEVIWREVKKNHDH